MKHIYILPLILSWFFTIHQVRAQAYGIPFKMILSDAGNPVPNQNVTVQCSVLRNNNVVYQERHNTTSDANGFIRLNIGEGTVVSGDFMNIDWSLGGYKLKVELGDTSSLVTFFEDDIQGVPAVKYALKGGSVTRLNDLEDVIHMGDDNLFMGEGSGVNIITGNTVNPTLNAEKNVAVGIGALHLLVTGDHNTALGHHALYSFGDYGNVAAGTYALLNADMSGNLNSRNTAIGSEALSKLSDWNDFANVAIGSSAYADTITERSVILGAYALANVDNTSPGNIVAAGVRASGQQPRYQTLSYGVAIGFESNKSADIHNSVSVGAKAMHGTYRGDVAIGYETLFNLADSTTTPYKDENVAFGYKALHGVLIYGDRNLGLGSNAFSTGNYEGSTGVGYNAVITGNNQVRLGNSSVTSIGGFANWSNLSDGRFKKDINENVPGIELVMKLRPVTYHLDMEQLSKYLKIPDERRDKKSEADKAAEVQIGFIAQEVEQAARELGFDFHAVDKPQNDHDLYGLRYGEFVPVLVKAVQELDEISNRNKQQAETNARALNEIRNTLNQLQSQIERIKNQQL